MRLKLIGAAIVLGLIMGHSNPGDLPPPPFNTPILATVVGVVDGDTIHVRIDDATDTVRLLRIDAPERQRRECWAQDATDALRRLLPINTQVSLVLDQQERDAYDRLLAHVWSNGNRVWVNGVMLHQGHAYPLTIAPNVAMTAEVHAAARYAQRQEVGVWSCPSIQ